MIKKFSEENLKLMSLLCLKYLFYSSDMVFQDKSILITSGVGSIGEILVEKINKEDPHVIRILDK